MTAERAIVAPMPRMAATRATADSVAAALRYAGEFSGFKVAAGIGYGEVTDGPETKIECASRGGGGSSTTASTTRISAWSQA